MRKLKRSTEQVLDACLARIAGGEDVEHVIRAHPELAAELRPVLELASAMQRAVPPPQHREANKAALLAAVSERRQRVLETDSNVAALRRGVPLAELLARAPAESRAALVAAHRMKVTAPPAPMHREAGKRQIMAQAARRRLARRAPEPIVGRVYAALGAVLSGLLPAPSAPRRAWSGVVATLATVLCLSAGVAGIGTVAASSVPGEPFYRIKRLSESAQLMFAFDPERRAGLDDRFSDRRLEEMVQLAQGGRQLPLYLVAEWIAGEADARAAISRLPTTEQRIIAMSLMQALDDGSGLEGWLRAVDADPVALEQIVVWARRLMAPAPEPAARITAGAPWTLDVLSSSGPLPGPRPLPPDEFEAPGPVRDDTPEPPAVHAPVVQPPSAPEAPAPQSGDEPVLVQPSNEADAEDGREPSEPAARPPDEPPVATPAPDEPPPYVQPPAGEPATPTPGSGTEEAPAP